MMDRDDLDRITMLDWLREKRPARARDPRFWNQVLVSAINEDLDRMAASHGFQVFRGASSPRAMATRWVCRSCRLASYTTLSMRATCGSICGRRWNT